MRKRGFIINEFPHNLLLNCSCKFYILPKKTMRWISKEKMSFPVVLKRKLKAREKMRKTLMQISSEFFCCSFCIESHEESPSETLVLTQLIIQMRPKPPQNNWNAVADLCPPSRLNWKVNLTIHPFRNLFH